MVDSEGINIDERIFEVKFACDIYKCKGGCCTVPGTLGAPLKYSEIDEIQEVIKYVEKYLDKKNLKVLIEEGFYVKYEKKIYLNNVNDRECVFCFYESDIAKCSFQKAYNSGIIKFKKPISCELFPVREYNNNGKELRYEKTYICEDALLKGEKLNITILEFVKDAVIRRYGEEFYINLAKGLKN
ncbi:MAG: DUF3109 family protein [Ignavibacteria bacterium]|jgi:hypothetical protein|nr:DUF3109 family protein [Ignavibacteria bacterium]